jgi:hypothetical protein
VYDLNYAPTTLRVQSGREIPSGYVGTKKVEYHCHNTYFIAMKTCPDV